MPNIVCPTKTPPACPCVDSDPVANFSSEAPDRDVFIANVFFDGTDNLGLNQIFDQLSCLGICESTISQEAADDCARQIAQICAWRTWRNQPGFTGKAPFRRGTPIPIFFNTFQSCNATCPDGTVFGWTIAAGTVAGRSQQEADALAQDLACQRAEKHRVCLSPNLPPACVASSYVANIVATGDLSAAPNTTHWAIVSGALPPGLTFTGGDVSGGQVTITGVPLVGGTFDFAVQVTESDGITVTKNYEIIVVFSTSPIFLPDASVGTPYSQQLTIGPLHDATTEKWTVNSGALPAGVTLSPAGLLSGTPTGPDATLSTFTVQVAALFPGNPLPCNCTFGPLMIQIGGCGQVGAPIPTTFSLPSVSLGAFAVNPDGTTVTVSAAAVADPYHVVYRGGAYKSPNNPCPSPSFKIPNEYRLNYNGGQINLSSPGFPCAGTQAGVEALMPLGRTDSFVHSGGGITFSTIFNDTGFVCGSSCPTWEVFHDPLIPQPINLRIHNYLVPNMNGDTFNDLIADSNCPGATVHPLFATSTTWDGSFGGTIPPNSPASHGDSYSASQFTDQTSYAVADKIKIGDAFFLDIVFVQGPRTGASINGDLFNLGFITNLPPTSMFWYFKITSNSQPGVKPGTPTLIWAGVKSYGQTAVGHYLTIANCNPNAPQCLTIEAVP